MSGMNLILTLKYHFVAGAIGYISYDYGNHLHNIENKNKLLSHPLYLVFMIGL